MPVCIDCGSECQALPLFDSDLALQELNEAMTEFAQGKSLVCQRRDIVFARHCVAR